MSTGSYHIDRRRQNGVTLSRQNNGMPRRNGRGMTRPNEPEHAHDLCNTLDPLDVRLQLNLPHIDTRNKYQKSISNRINSKHKHSIADTFVSSIDSLSRPINPYQSLRDISYINRIINSFWCYNCHFDVM
eukprot:862901_1